MMMLMRVPTALLLALLPACVVSAQQQVLETSGLNLGSTENSIMYHGDQACNRVSYNAFKSNLQRHMTYQKFKPTGFGAVPNQRTVMCPETVQDLHSGTTSGYDTVWIVENTASDPVVLTYIDPSSGVEYSALNTKVTPPQDDPDAILQPGKWRALYTWEGHTFLARQLLESSSDGGASKLGPVLMQHRTGLIPIGMQAQDLQCNPLMDIEPLINDERAPDMARTPPAIHRMCNTIDLGFRNMANCPLNGYFVSSLPDSQNVLNVNETKSTGASFNEHFKFHLGLNPISQDFMWSWDSRTKFEGTFVGHTFSFRDAVTGHLVDTHTLRPTRIPDCPNLKQKAQVNRVTSVAMAAAVLLPNGKKHTNATDTDTDTTITDVWNLNGTSTTMTSRNRRRTNNKAGAPPFAHHHHHHHEVPVIPTAVWAS